MTLHSSSRCTESKAYIDLECCLPLIDLIYDVTEDEYLIDCALLLSKSSLFFSKNMVYTVLYSLDDDSPHYFAGHRQQCHTTPIFSLFQISSFWYFHYQAFLPLVRYLLLMPYSIKQSCQLLYYHITICFVQLCWDTLDSRCSSTPRSSSVPASLLLLLSLLYPSH